MSIFKKSNETYSDANDIIDILKTVSEPHFDLSIRKTSKIMFQIMPYLKKIENNRKFNNFFSINFKKKQKTKFQI